MTLTKIVKDRWVNFLPLMIVGVFYLVSYLYIHGYQYGICPNGTGVGYYSCGDMDDYYGTPLLELSLIIIPSAILALFMPKNTYKRWLIVFFLWLSATLWWMLSIPYPRATWQNYRSAAADLSGAVFLLGTLVWLGIYCLIMRWKKRKGVSISS